MMTSRKNDARLQTEFARRRRLQFFLLIPMGLGVLALGAASKGSPFFGLPPEVAMTAGLVIAGAAAIVSLFNWRCPSCGASLGKSWNPRFCPGCGVALRG